jgi:hypothetical protein
MAIIRKKFIIGSMGTWSFREINGVQIAQSKPGPGNMKQTDMTKKAATVFGKGSAFAKKIRMMFKSVIMDLNDGAMVNRLTTLVNSILGQCYNKKDLSYSFTEDSFERLIGFDFNIKSPLKNNLWKTPENTMKDGILTIRIPELKVNEDLIFPKQANKCVIQIQVKSYNLEDGFMGLSQEGQSVEIESTQTLLEEQEFNFTVPDGCLSLIAISLRYYTFEYDTVLFNSKTFHPAGICGAFITPGEFKKEKEYYWNGPAAKAAFGKSATTDQASLHLQP